MMLAVVVLPVYAETPWTAVVGTATWVEPLPGGSERVSKDFTMWFGRNLRERYWVDMNDERLTGTMIHTYSGNLHVADDPEVVVYGPLYGSIYLSNDGGYWEGRTAGLRTEQGYNYAHSVLHGHGDYEGLIAHLYHTRETTGLYDVIMVHGFVK
jgi:hypothetical protein